MDQILQQLGESAFRSKITQGASTSLINARFVYGSGPAHPATGPPLSFRLRYFFKSAAISLRASMCASCSPVMASQPSQLFSSVPVQSEASFCHSLATLLFRFQSSMDAATAPASGPANL